MVKYTKLSNEDVRHIIDKYLNTDETFSSLARKYNCNQTKISNAVKKAIILGMVNLKDAQKIKAKASYNSNMVVIEKRV